MRAVTFPLLVFWGLLVTSQVTEGAIKCSAMEYTASVGTCVGGFIRDTMTQLNARVSIKDYLTGMCKSGQIDQVVACLGEVEDMCGYSFLPKTIMSRASKLLCKEGPDLILQCRLKPDTTALMSCANNFNVDASRPVCSTAEHLKPCLNALLGSCKANLGSDIVDAIVGKPCKEPSDWKCPILHYGMAMNGCYQPLSMAIIRSLNNSRTDSVDTKIQKICALSELAPAFNCHKNADQKCGYSLVNSDQLKDAMDKFCQAKGDVQHIGSCVDVGKTYITHVKCLLKEFTNLGAGDVPCKLMRGVKKCAGQIFDTRKAGCPLQNMAKIKSMFEAIVDMITPCGSSASECSTMQYVATLPMCWFPTGFKAAMDQIGTARITSEALKKIIEVFRGGCGSVLRSIGKRCHEKLDQKCDVSFVRADKFSDLAKTVCDAKKPTLGLTKEFMGKCFKVEPLKQCKIMDLVQNKVTSKDELCRLVAGVATCTRASYSGCTKSITDVTDVLNSGIDTILPSECKFPSTPTPTPQPKSRGMALRQSVVVVSVLLLLECGKRV